MYIYHNHTLRNTTVNQEISHPKYLTIKMHRKRLGKLNWKYRRTAKYRERKSELVTLESRSLSVVLCKIHLKMKKLKYNPMYNSSSEWDVVILVTFWVDKHHETFKDSRITMERCMVGLKLGRCGCQELRTTSDQKPCQEWEPGISEKEKTSRKLNWWRIPAPP